MTDRSASGRAMVIVTMAWRGGLSLDGYAVGHARGAVLFSRSVGTACLLYQQALWQQIQKLARTNRL
jgi:hypothetical protein